MFVKYYCENCGKSFESEDAARRHESDCKRTRPVKIIILSRVYKDGAYGFEFETRIENWSFHSSLLDGVQTIMDGFVMYTEDMSSEVEKKLKRQLLQAASDWLKQQQERCDGYAKQLFSELSKSLDSTQA